MWAGFIPGDLAYRPGLTEAAVGGTVSASSSRQKEQELQGRAQHMTPSAEGCGLTLGEEKQAVNLLPNREMAQCSQGVPHLPDAVLLRQVWLSLMRQWGLCFPPANKVRAALGSTASIYRSVFVLPSFNKKDALICPWAHRCCKAASPMLTSSETQ